MEALELVAASAERIEEAGLLEVVRDVNVLLLLRDGGEVDEDLVHAPVLGA